METGGHERMDQVSFSLAALLPEQRHVQSSDCRIALSQLLCIVNRPCLLDAQVLVHTASQAWLELFQYEDQGQAAYC